MPRVGSRLCDDRVFHAAYRVLRPVVFSRSIPPPRTDWPRVVVSVWVWTRTVVFENHGQPTGPRRRERCTPARAKKSVTIPGVARGQELKAEGRSDASARQRHGDC